MIERGSIISAAQFSNPTNTDLHMRGAQWPYDLEQMLGAAGIIHH